MSDKELEFLENIKNIERLKELISHGYRLKGPREEDSKNLSMIEKYFIRGYEFVPEHRLLKNGYQLVEPSSFTKGLQFAYKTTGELLQKYYKSNYSLLKGNSEIALYLKYEEKG